MFSMVDTILLSPNDNIVVLARSAASGDSVLVDGRYHTLPHTVGLGHKLARSEIEAGEKILKYGVPIGSATRTISPGEHVHLHNMKSDYLPTFTLDKGQHFHA
jgi:hypothetical protein